VLHKLIKGLQIPLIYSLTDELVNLHCIKIKKNKKVAITVQHIGQWAGLGLG
jgi:hypothetical protein